MLRRTSPRHSWHVVAPLRLWSAPNSAPSTQQMLWDAEAEAVLMHLYPLLPASGKPVPVESAVALCASFSSPVSGTPVDSLLRTAISSATAESSRWRRWLKVNRATATIQRRCLAVDPRSWRNIDSDQSAASVEDWVRVVHNALVPQLLPIATDIAKQLPVGAPLLDLWGRDAPFMSADSPLLSMAGTQQQPVISLSGEWQSAAPALNAVPAVVTALQLHWNRTGPDRAAALHDLSRESQLPPAHVRRVLSLLPDVVVPSRTGGGDRYDRVESFSVGSLQQPARLRILDLTAAGRKLPAQQQAALATAMVAERTGARDELEDERPDDEGDDDKTAVDVHGPSKAEAEQRELLRVINTKKSLGAVGADLQRVLRTTNADVGMPLSSLAEEAEWWSYGRRSLKKALARFPASFELCKHNGTDWVRQVPRARTLDASTEDERLQQEEEQAKAAERRAPGPYLEQGQLETLLRLHTVAVGWGGDVVKSDTEVAKEVTTKVETVERIRAHLMSLQRRADGSWSSPFRFDVHGEGFQGQRPSHTIQALMTKLLATKRVGPKEYEEVFRIVVLPWLVAMFSPTTSQGVGECAVPPLLTIPDRLLAKLSGWRESNLAEVVGDLHELVSEYVGPDAEQLDGISVDDAKLLKRVWVERQEVGGVLIGVGSTSALAAGHENPPGGAASEMADAPQPTPTIPPPPPAAPMPPPPSTPPTARAQASPNTPLASATRLRPVKFATASEATNRLYQTVSSFFEIIFPLLKNEGVSLHWLSNRIGHRFVAAYDGGTLTQFVRRYDGVFFQLVPSLDNSPEHPPLVRPHTSNVYETVFYARLIAPFLPVVTRTDDGEPGQAAYDLPLEELEAALMWQDRFLRRFGPLKAFLSRQRDLAQLLSRCEDGGHQVPLVGRYVAPPLATGAAYATLPWVVNGASHRGELLRFVVPHIPGLKTKSIADLAELLGCTVDVLVADLELISDAVLVDSDGSDCCVKRCDGSLAIEEQISLLNGFTRTTISVAPLPSGSPASEIVRHLPLHPVCAAEVANVVLGDPQGWAEVLRFALDDCQRGGLSRVHLMPDGGPMVWRVES